MVGEGGQVRPSLAEVVRLFEGVPAGWCGGGGAVLFFPLGLSRGDTVCCVPVVLGGSCWVVLVVACGCWAWCLGLPRLGLRVGSVDFWLGGVGEVLCPTPRWACRCAAAGCVSG